MGYFFNIFICVLELNVAPCERLEPHKKSNLHIGVVLYDINCFYSHSVYLKEKKWQPLNVRFHNHSPYDVIQMGILS